MLSSWYVVLAAAQYLIFVICYPKSRIGEASTHPLTLLTVLEEIP